MRPYEKNAGRVWRKNGRPENYAEPGHHRPIFPDLTKEQKERLAEFFRSAQLPRE